MVTKPMGDKGDDKNLAFAWTGEEDMFSGGHYPAQLIQLSFKISSALANRIKK